jgi:ribosomal protein S18 acetylase RimI-like enzyme
MIYVRAAAGLSDAERWELSTLILGAFKESRLGAYETVVYCKMGRVIVGMVGLYWVGRYLCLNQLCVREAYRRRGIGRLLLDGVFAMYPDAKLVLYVDKHGEDADWLVEFYEKRGFREVGSEEETQLARDHETEYLMVREPPAV